MTAAGGVKCWGNNSAGLLGDGTTDQRLTAVDVVGLTSGVAAVSAGSFAHTCALTTAGGVKCWGNNNVGQLGDGTTTERLTPVDVVGLTSGVVAIDVGEAHTCALTTVGGVKCWGQNFAGHLGDGTTTERLTPVDVAGLTSGVVAVSAGQFHTCAVTTTGGIKCWGNNNSGQLGDGTTIEQLTAVDVSGLTSGVAAVSAGQQHTCAITNSGGLKCWGTNFAGQLGDGTTTERLTPADVTGLTSGVAAVTADASSSHTCALTTAGGVKCWGRNTLGQLGAGIPTNRLTPADVLGL
jgi:alpha-tubulin suppressor-like RCC1 family protein